ncbi:MAG: hypothetical protein K2X39_08405, partial [Silvanigrellaceae bacterium]|nr:hypothetical protein [Silvanigrellaceae bacterium]
ASRGLNGIDGQISTFLGFSEEKCENWAIVGDLTALYDFAAFWMLSQRPDLKVNIVIVNNYGAKIFQHLLTGKAADSAQNSHKLDFASWSTFWGIGYEKWQNTLPPVITSQKSRIIELIPDAEETEKFRIEFLKI